MSLASLAAYASSDDDSDADDTPAVPAAEVPSSSTAPARAPEPTPARPTALSGRPPVSAVDLIEDDPDFVTNGSVTSSLPPALATESGATSGSVFQADDVVDDVPLADKLHAEKPKKSGKVRISIPSLTQFRDDKDGEPAAKKPKPASKGCGLFSLLPPPKSQPLKLQGRALLPQSVSRPPPPRPVAAARASVAPVINAAPHTEEEPEPPPSSGGAGGAGGGDFFSLTESEPAAVVLPAAAVAGPLTYSERVLAEQAAERQRMAEQAAAAQLQPVAMETDGFDEEARRREAQARLEAEAVQQLGGRRGRRERDIQIVDVNQDDLTASRTEWMTKALTEEAVVRRPQKSSDDPTSQQRRKHQITYLAHQAKEREVELKNEWAQNRATKNAYRSKYGF